ncbi:MAG: cysteine desulfurase [Planctomycetota bacterium]|nr:MAG: cysteine desulfurase [Planctomycetota bacterium]
MQVYLDNNATTRVAPEVLDAMLPWFRERWGNPSSLHALGAEAARALAEARERTATALGADATQVVFTSGGTEANNLALQGAARALRRRGDHAVTTAVEHPSVLEVFRALEAEGLRVTYVPVAADGTLDADAFVEAVGPQTIVASLMHAQNETGAVFPVEAIAARAKARRKELFVHVDGVQALGKLPPPGEVIDAYTVSAHKVHGPKGAGALRLGRRARVAALLHGGGQERGLRSGTEALPAWVGLGVAALRAHETRRAFASRAQALGSRLRTGIEAAGGVVNSPPNALPSTLNASFPGLPAEPLLHALEARGVFVSTGSACASRKGKRSPVLRAMGLPDERVDSALRFSLSRETTAEEVEAAVGALAEAVAELRARVGRC